eukprot:218522-Chlamydomonas_euryale.AAC.6
MGLISAPRPRWSICKLLRAGPCWLRRMPGWTDDQPCRTLQETCSVHKRDLSAEPAAARTLANTCGAPARAGRASSLGHGQLDLQI